MGGDPGGLGPSPRSRKAAVRRRMGEAARRLGALIPMFSPSPYGEALVLDAARLRTLNLADEYDCLGLALLLLTSPRGAGLAGRGLPRVAAYENHGGRELWRLNGEARPPADGLYAPLELLEGVLGMLEAERDPVDPGRPPETA